MEIECEDVDWMNVAQDMDQWQYLVNTVMKFWVLQKTENFLTS